MSWCLIKATCFEPLVLHHSEISIWFTRKWEVLLGIYLQYLSTPSASSRKAAPEITEISWQIAGMWQSRVPAILKNAPLFSLNRNEKYIEILRMEMLRTNLKKVVVGEIWWDFPNAENSVPLGFPYSNVDSKIERYWNVWHLSREDTCTEQSHRKDKHKQL